jgi:hypothetical protein
MDRDHRTQTGCGVATKDDLLAFEILKQLVGDASRLGLIESDSASRPSRCNDAVLSTVGKLS